MLLVVFGAGASYDSVPSRPPSVFNSDLRLPLSNELFADRPSFTEVLRDFADTQPIVPDLRHLQPGQSVERVLEALQANGTQRRQRQIAAIRYYLQLMITRCEYEWEKQIAHGITNYKSLLDRIELFRKPGEVVCLVTFNYDTMLETALTSVGLNITSLNSYVAGNQYKVIKLHGSVTWGRLVEESAIDLSGLNAWNTAQALIDQGADLKVSDNYVLAGKQMPLHKLDDRVLYPAIAIPLQRKLSYECPAEHIETLNQLLPSVDRLLVIGWRATDTPFLELLRTRGRQNLRALVAAGRKDWSEEVLANLRQGLDRPGELVASAGGFTDLILQHEADEFLKS